MPIRETFPIPYFDFNNFILSIDYSSLSFILPDAIKLQTELIDFGI